MQPQEQYELYKIFCDLMTWYSKDMSLSMADNEIARRYASSVSRVTRYLVQTFAHLGVHDVYAHKAVNYEKGKFVGIPDPSYSFINTIRYPELGNLVAEMEKLFNASQRCHRDTFDMAINVADYVKKVIPQLRKFNYSLSADIQKKVDIVISNGDLALASINSNFNLGMVKSIKGGTQPTAFELRDRRIYYWDFVSDVFNYFYKYFKQRNDEFTFHQIFETAHFDTRYTGTISKEESLKQTYKLFKVPESSLPHVRLRYTTLESVTVKPKVTTSVSKPKKVVTPQPKIEESKKVTTKKVEVKEKPITPIKKQEVKVEKKIESVYEGEVNVLDISTHTKLANGYRIDKVENKAKKIIVDDRVVEFNSHAFLECYKLEEITIGKNVDIIKFGQFANLKNLVKVTFNEGLLEIENNAFENTNLQGTITLPSSLMMIGKRAFQVNNPNVLTINVSFYTMYQENSFHNLSKVYIDGKLLEKEKEEEVKEVVIEKSPVIDDTSSSSLIRYVDYISDFIVHVESDDCCDDEYAFLRSYDDDGRCLAYGVVEAHEVMIVSNPIKVIEFNQYSEEAYDIKKLVLSDDVEEISPNNSFYSFYSLQELVLPNNSKFTKLPKRMFTYVNNKIIHLEIPNCVKEIDPDCFEGSSIIYLTIGKDVDISKVNFPHRVNVYRKKS